MSNLKHAKPLPLKNVTVTDNFWSHYIDLVHDVVIPYEWDALNDKIPGASPSYCIENFRIAAGDKTGEHRGFVFQDHGLVTWLEAVGHSLSVRPDSAMEALADEAIELIGRAQQPDGYINTYFTLKEPDKRWTNLLECHELFCAGHMIEAAVAYYEATGKRRFLEIVCRFADYIDSVFGSEEGKLHGYDGHEEIELALVKLYHATGQQRYLNLAKYFINQRGSVPNYFEQEWEKRGGEGHFEPHSQDKPVLMYFQDHAPVREQTEAVGHAVRAVYLYTAMADLAAELGDESLLLACKRLWDSITLRKLYITGGIGSTAIGEAFSADYDLPADTIYQETCASIGLVFFAFRMLMLENDSKYADIMEQALYNSVISGISMDGKSFFYVNPLEVWPGVDEANPSRAHIKPVRQPWFSCACCPPNVARTLPTIGSYVYTTTSDTIYTHLYIQNKAEIPLGDTTVTLKTETNYPYDGSVSIKTSAGNYTLALRIPSWCKGWTVKVNSEPLDVTTEKGYIYIKRQFAEGDCVCLDFDMPAELICADSRVRAVAGRVALRRGPLVYCVEQVDNGENPHNLFVYPQAFDIVTDENTKLPYIRGKAYQAPACAQGLYHTYDGKYDVVQFTAVPYFYWGNRQPGAMTVWLHAVNRGDINGV